MDNKLILLVDGDAEPLARNERELARCSGGAFSFLKAGTIAEARALLPQKPDVVIMETALPDGSGFELMRDIRLTANAFILVLTESDKVEDEVEWFVRGASQYITKPCSAQVLYHRVMALLKSGAPPKHEIIGVVTDGSRRTAVGHAPQIADVEIYFSLLRITCDNGTTFTVDLDTLAGAPGYEALWKDELYLHPETDGETVCWQGGPRYTLDDITFLIIDKYQKYWPPETEGEDGEQSEK